MKNMGWNMVTSNYPCKECILKVICSKLCEKVWNIKDNDLVNFILEKKHCPDCGCEKVHKEIAWNSGLSFKYVVCSMCSTKFRFRFTLISKDEEFFYIERVKKVNNNLIDRIVYDTKVELLKNVIDELRGD
jgi:hypothetical protein